MKNHKYSPNEAHIMDLNFLSSVNMSVNTYNVATSLMGVGKMVMIRLNISQIDTAFPST